MGALAKAAALMLLPAGLVVYDGSTRQPEQIALQAGTAVTYQGAVRWYIADLKPSFPEHKQYSHATALTASNYRAVLDGLKTNVKVNGIRLPIFPTYPDANAYPPLYKTVIGYARDIGLAIYASPLSVGMGEYRGWSDERYAAWLADYANVYAPDFLSPFNEAGLPESRVETITADLRARLGTRTLLTGPDRQHVEKTIEDLASDQNLGNAFDIVTSHNANQDHTATSANWARLVQMVGGQKPVWASENPGTWSERRTQALPGIVDAVEGGVQGIVIWLAKPSLVDDAGRATPKAIEIASHLVASP